jgi:hypothetical protein
MKKGQLTQQEKYTIRGMFYDKKTLEEICKFTDRSKYVVNKFLEFDINTTIKNTKDQTKKNKKDKQKNTTNDNNRQSVSVKDFIIHETVSDSGKDKDDPDRRGGVSIMTEPASQQGDANKLRNTKTRSRYNKHIHKINKNG